MCGPAQGDGDSLKSGGIEQGCSKKRREAKAKQSKAKPRESVPVSCLMVVFLRGGGCRVSFLLRAIHTDSHTRRTSPLPPLPSFCFYMQSPSRPSLSSYAISRPLSPRSPRHRPGLSGTARGRARRWSRAWGSSGGGWPSPAPNPGPPLSLSLVVVVIVRRSVDKTPKGGDRPTSPAAANANTN